MSEQLVHPLRLISRGRIPLACVAVTLVAASAIAMVPPPPNDDPANAAVIATLPALIRGTTVNANDSINTIPSLPAITDFVDGPDVFYSFTPAATSTYRIQVIPWHFAPLRSSDWRFTSYIYEATTNGFLAGARAPGDARPFNYDVVLDAGVEYIIGVDHDDEAHDNFPFTLIVDELNLTNPDNCMSATALPAALPVVVLNNIDGAANDFNFTQSADQCAVSGTTPTIADGIDHVYEFTPAATGEYAIELVGEGFNAVLYVDDSCPPFFLDGCQGASDHSTSGTSGGKHEFVVVTLFAGTPYYIYVDEGGTNNAGSYALIIDTAESYEVTEVELNDSSGTATPTTTPLAGGQLVGPADEDWWGVAGSTGDRVYAWVNNGGSTNSTLDTDLGFYAADGATLIEFDDEDGDGIDAPVEDLRFVYSTTAPVIAGAMFTTNGTHYLRVTDQSATGTVSHYRFHVGVEPADRNPLAECEPNDSFATADQTGKNYFSGSIDTTDDLDYYAIDLVEGDRVFIAFDGDPERDSTGVDSANTDPNAFHGKLVVYDADNDVLISDISDSNTAQATVGPDYPAQGAFFIARQTGTYYVEVGPQSSASQVGPTETYHLAVFIDNAAPALAEPNDPVVTLTPDLMNNEIDLMATDDGMNDTGICSIELVNNDNLQIVGAFTPGDAVVNVTIDLIDAGTNGSAKLVVYDCAGNATCDLVAIDVSAPVCDGFNFSNRSPMSMHEPIHVPDNDLNGTTNGTIEITSPGIITDVNVTINAIDALDTGDLDIFLVSPAGTQVELVTDRMSSLAIDMRDTRFDDEEGTEILPILSSAAPFTGTWLVEDPLGLAKLDGEQAQGVWTLLVIDDASSESFGATLVKWSLDIDATFPGPETFAGTTTDLGDGGGIQSIVLTSGTNVQLNLPPGFMPGDQVVDYTVTLLDVSTDGMATVTVTDLSNNTCQSVITLAGFPDNTGPANSGEVTTSLTFSQEVQVEIPSSDPNGFVTSIGVPDSFLVGEVEVAIMADAEDQGRIAATLSHNGEFAALINRIGMDERQALGNSKASFDVVLDDDAPQSMDIHLEPALGSQSTLGTYQPDGRGEFIGDGITTDDRDHMLFRLAGLDSAGEWELFIGDFRAQGTVDNRFRRWSMTLKNPCGPERFVGTAKDVAPGTGIQSIALAPGANNLQVVANFTPGDEVVDYRVELIDPLMSGAGTLEITDVAGNVTALLINLAAASGDDNLPIVSGNVNPATFQFEGMASDNQAGDTGVAAIELAPYSDNLQIVSTSSLPAPTATFTVGLVDPMANGRGYVRVTDGCGLRSHILVEIDRLSPVCTGETGTTKRYFSGFLGFDIPDNNPAGVESSILVSDLDVITDVNVTFNITHGFDDDIDLSFSSPVALGLISDLGSLGNDFIDTTLDDEAAGTPPDSSTAAPFTGSFQPEDGNLSVFDGSPANGTYTLKVVDDKSNDFGTFDSWSLVIETATFPDRFDGRAEDSETYDTGICSVDLDGSSMNLSLTVDPAFSAGDAIVRYSVELANASMPGTGKVIVTDCAGNICDQTVCLAPAGAEDCNTNGTSDYCDIFLGASADVDGNGVPDECQDCVSLSACPDADVNCDNVVSGLDIAIITNSANFGLPVGLAADPRADVNGDGTVSGLDVAAAQSSACFGL